MEFYKPSSYVRLWIINLTHKAEEDIHLPERRDIRADERTQHVIVDIKNICACVSSSDLSANGY